MTQLNILDAIAARDKALAEVSKNAGSWINRALDRILSLPADWRGTGEDLRILIASSETGNPHHHNAWGALIRTAVLRKYLIPTGEFRNMKTRKSHARKTQVYTR